MWKAAGLDPGSSSERLPFSVMASGAVGPQKPPGLLGLSGCWIGPNGPNATLATN